MLLLVALASLFSTLEAYVWDAKLRPFDALVLIMFSHLVLTRGLDTRLPRGLVLCGMFFAVHAVGALLLGPRNFIREGMQVGVVLVFGAYLYNSLTAKQLRRFLPVFTSVLFVIMLYNIFWHLDQGYYTGWKRLDAPKMAFFSCPYC